MSLVEERQWEGCFNPTPGPSTVLIEQWPSSCTPFNISDNLEKGMLDLAEKSEERSEMNMDHP